METTKTYTICYTREVTEQATFAIKANSADEAKEIALKLVEVGGQKFETKKVHSTMLATTTNGK